MLGYGVTAYVCYPGDHPVGLGAGAGRCSRRCWRSTRIALAACAAGALVSWRGLAHACAPGEGRNRFLALWGLMSSLWFFAAILFNVIASVMVPPCVS